MLGSLSEAEDAVQESWLRSIPGCRPPAGRPRTPSTAGSARSRRHRPGPAECGRRRVSGSREGR
ncbi:hypothetical protein [Rhodococcus opacus]|uniref:hypothetical protein n=1 Tax=Rhodococcus opacus TaxID=37919 RepID=UPI003B00747E